MEDVDILKECHQLRELVVLNFTRRHFGAPNLYTPRQGDYGHYIDRQLELMQRAHPLQVDNLIRGLQPQPTARLIATEDTEELGTQQGGEAAEAAAVRRSVRGKVPRKRRFGDS